MQKLIQLIMQVLRKVIPEGYLTILSGAALILYGLLYLVDTQLHDLAATTDLIETAWLTHTQYESVLTLIIGTGTVGAADKIERLISIFKTYKDAQIPDNK